MNHQKRSFSIDDIRKDFPILSKRDSYGNVVVYLDNSATTQKPKCVIDKLCSYYINNNANVHRGYYKWGEISTIEYENVRKLLKTFLNANDENEFIFTRGATEGLNCLAEIVSQRYLKEGDEIIVSELEHHSNLIPWQMQQAKRDVKIKAWNIDENGTLNIKKLEHLLTKKTKLLSVAYVSNVLGSTPNIKEMVSMAHSNGTFVILDAAQAVAHLPIDLKYLDCDFMVASGHKMYGPLGSGFFYGKHELLNELPPYFGGGTMMETVTMNSFTPSNVPSRFEAGTPPIADIIGLGEAIKYLMQFSWEEIVKHEDDVMNYAIKSLKAIDRIEIIGNPDKRTSVLSFNIKGIHPHDVATLMNDANIALRAGFHCCQPLMKRLKCNCGVVRLSFGLYNTKSEVDQVVDAINNKVFKVFKNHE